MEPWKQCGQWLISCKVLPPNHRVTWETAQVFDLAQTLRDGVLLCQLLNNLRSHSINLKEINLRPQMSQVRRPRRPRGSPRALSAASGGAEGGTAGFGKLGAPRPARVHAAAAAAAEGGPAPAGRCASAGAAAGRTPSGPAAPRRAPSLRRAAARPAGSARPGRWGEGAAEAAGRRLPEPP